MSQLGYYGLYPNIFTTNNDEYHYGTSFGSELLTNTDFSSGLTGWSADAGWSAIAAGLDNPYARATGSITNANLTQDLSVTSGNYYKIEFKLVQPSGTNYQLLVSLAGYSLDLVGGGSPGGGARDYQFYIKAANSGGSGPSLGFNIKATVAGSTYIGIKNISVKEVLTTETLNSQWTNADVSPRKGSLTSLTSDQTPWYFSS